MPIEEKFNKPEEVPGQLYINFDYLDERNEIIKKYGIMNEAVKELKKIGDVWYVGSLTVKQWAGIDEGNDNSDQFNLNKVKRVY